MTVKNTLRAKLKRTITSVLPVDKKRRGQCSNCGQCCYLPFKCPFLKITGSKSCCTIYYIRPLNCRKYPRVEKECLTKDTCSYYFKKNKTFNNKVV